MTAARKKKKKRKKRQRGRAGPKSTGCTALMVVDSSRIRRKVMGNCKRARTTFEKAERELDAYESGDKPAFIRWYHAALGTRISEAKSLSEEVRNLHLKMQRLVRFADLADCSRQQAAQLYEESPQEFERREREHAERLQREEERRRREFEVEREAAGRDIRNTFAAFLESRSGWIRKLRQRGALRSEIFFELLAAFCDEHGFFPPVVTMVLDHPEGMALLEQYGLDVDFDFDDEDVFDPEFESDGDGFENIFDTPRQATKTMPDETRLKSLRRELAFALHPDQSDSDSDPVKLELWHQVQEAVENRDLDRLEGLHAHCQMLSGELSPQTQVSRLQALTDMYRRSRDALRRRIRALRKKPEWGFNAWDESDREQMRSRLEALLNEQVEDLRADLAEAHETYRRHFAPRPARRRPHSEPPVGETLEDPDQIQFDFV
jgi:hypothetical protein